MKIKNFVALTIIFLFFSFSCKETPPEPGNGIVNNGMLIVEDVGVTDAVIRLRVPRGFKSRSVILKRLPAEQAGDTTTIFHSPLSPATGGQATHHFLIDTLIIDEGLLPKHSYRYALTVNNFLNLQERSYADVVTMDTTSHEFTWQIDTLGDGHSSALYDVAILNDTLAYAVGEIKKKDSTGNYEYQPYNVARWDGKQWQLLKLEFPLYNYDCTVAGYLASKTTTIFGFNPNSILISDGGSVAKWDGATLTQYPCILNWITNGELLKIWGRSENDFYVVGRNGTILQYYFGTWQKLESGTDVNLTDVWGSPDGSVVWACGYFNNKRGTYLLRKNSDSWEVAYDGTSTEFNLLLDTLSGAFTSVYTPSNRYIYVCSHYGLYKASSNTRGEAKRYSYTSSTFPGFPRGMRGNGINDITIAGDYTMISRWNGFTWRYYEELRNSKIHFNAVAQKGNLIAAVGVIPDPINGKGIVYLGKR